MARIRSIHPGIFTDEAFMGLTVEYPLAIPLLLGLWAEADDAGAFEWKPLTLKARILPAATCDTPDLLEALVGANFVKRFEIDGRHIGVIRNFVKFQRPKSPVDSHPFTAESRAFAGFGNDGKRPRSGTGRPPAIDHSEPLPNHFRTTSEVSPQRKEEGGRMEEELLPLESSNELSSGSSTALPLDLPPQPEILDLRKARERKAESDLDLLDKITDLWNAWARRHGSPQVQRLNDTRAKHCRRRIVDLKAFGHDSPEAAFEFLLEKCSLSFYARGSPRKPLDFDQLMREDFMTKMLEGVYEYREARRV